MDMTVVKRKWRWAGLGAASERRIPWVRFLLPQGHQWNCNALSRLLWVTGCPHHVFGTRQTCMRVYIRNDPLTVHSACSSTYRRGLWPRH
jgi:hypothetical protein